MSVSDITGQPFPRGAIPTPRHKLLAAVPHFVIVAPPDRFAVVPKRLDMWGNDQEGDCVSAEEAFAKAAWSTYCGLPETFATAQEVMAFAARYGYANGADLTSVMDTMKSAGMSISGVNYKDGSYSGVDYSNEATLQSALTVGPVKIAIDANALPREAGNKQGWFSISGGRFPNTDHCVALAGYGPADWLYQQLGISLPAGLPATTAGYLLFTWSTIGFVSHQWLMSTTTEAWVRNPTTPGQSPAPAPTPGPSPIPTPPGPSPVPTGAFHLQISADCNPPHGMSPATYTITPRVPLPNELAGLGAPPWIAILLQLLGPKFVLVIPVILADLKAGKGWDQITLDLLTILFTAQSRAISPSALLVEMFPEPILGVAA